MEENKGLLLKCAMSYGLAMGIYWVVPPPILLPL